MYNLLNAGFGNPIRGLHSLIADVGFSGIRQDVPFYDFAKLTKIIRECELYDADLILLFAGGQMEWTAEDIRLHVSETAKYINDEDLFKQRRVFFEIGNEPDIAVDRWKKSPKDLNDVFWECYQTVKMRRSDFEVITPSISNLNWRGLDYLREFLSEPIPCGSIVGFHRYPNGSDPIKPHSGFKSRQDELNRLRKIVPNFRLFCTETGASQGPHKMRRRFPLCLFKRKFYLTEMEQHNIYEGELEFYMRNAVEGMVWYQLNDGLNRDAVLDNYGIRRVDGEVKKGWL